MARQTIPVEARGGGGRWREARGGEERWREERGGGGRRGEARKGEEEAERGAGQR